MFWVLSMRASQQVTLFSEFFLEWPNTVPRLPLAVCGRRFLKASPTLLAVKKSKCEIIQYFWWD